MWRFWRYFLACASAGSEGSRRMAQRYGGKYSPHGDAPDGDKAAAPERGAFDGARIDPVGPAANALFLPPVLLVFLSIFGGVMW